jgi:MarR family transcriptional regulator for hemolysin
VSRVRTSALPGAPDLDGAAGAQKTLSSMNRKRAIAIKMAVASRQLRQRFDERVEQTGVTRAKWMLIATVASRPGATQRIIASLLEVSDVTAGRLIDRVCADGLLERRENPQDRRAYCVYLTPAAQPVLDQMASVAELYETEIFAGFTYEELESFNTLLDKLSENLNLGRRDCGDRKALSSPTAVGKQEANAA